MIFLRAFELSSIFIPGKLVKPFRTKRILSLAMFFPVAGDRRKEKSYNWKSERKLFVGMSEIELLFWFTFFLSMCFIINWRTRPNENDLSNHSRCSFIPFTFFFSTNGDKNHVTYTNAFIATASHSFSYFTCLAILQQKKRYKYRLRCLFSMIQNKQISDERENGAYYYIMLIRLKNTKTSQLK